MKEKKEGKEMFDRKAFDAGYFILHVSVPFVKRCRYITPQGFYAFMKGYCHGAKIERIPIGIIRKKFIELNQDIKLSAADQRIIGSSKILFEAAIRVIL